MLVQPSEESERAEYLTPRFTSNYLNIILYAKYIRVFNTIILKFIHKGLFVIIICKLVIMSLFQVGSMHPRLLLSLDLCFVGW